jgi:predicted aspartyl protease
MSEDRLPAAFDRTSLIGTEPYRAGSLGPRSPWSPERGDRRGFLPTPDPEAAGPGRQQRGWKVRNGALTRGRDDRADGGGEHSSRRRELNGTGRSHRRRRQSAEGSGEPRNGQSQRRVRINSDESDNSDVGSATQGASYDDTDEEHVVAASKFSRRLERVSTRATGGSQWKQSAASTDDSDGEQRCQGATRHGRLRSKVTVPAADGRRVPKDERRDSENETDRHRSRDGRHGGSRKHRSSTRSGSRQHRERHHRRHKSSSVEGASDSRPHRIKPRTFDGSGSFETFWAHFENCATYNRWKEADKLAHLKATLIGDAGQVLWDSESSATNTLEKLTQLLRSRFSATRQADKHRMELKLRRRRPGETLSALHQDIHRLMALAHPTLSQDARETIACDYYIDAMDDADFALKIRERAPTTLDEALRIALQLEAWQRDVRRSRADDYNQLKPKARGAAQAAAVEPSFETQFTQLNQRIDELTRIVQAVAAARPSATNVTTSTRSTMEGAAMSSNGNKAVVEEQADKAQGGALPTWQRSWSRQPRAARQPTNVCWYCGQTGHFRRECKQRAPATTETQGAITRGGRGLDRALVYIRMNIGDKAVPCLLDSGCEVTLIPKAVAEATKDIEVQPTNHRIWAANGTEVEVTGETKVALKLDGRRIETFALVSPDVEEVMLGADWLQTHNCLWDFGNGKLYIDGRAAVPLSRKRSLCCRRVYVQEELVLPPKQQVNVVARSTLCTPSRVVADSWVIESRQLRSGLYVGRTLLPSTHRDLLVRMINTTSEPQLLPINTCLGNLAPVEVLEGTASTLPATCGEQAATEKREQLAPINEAASVATGMEAANEVQPVENNNNDTVVSVSAGEQLQAEQLQDSDIGPVLRLRLQRAEAPSINELLPESEATKIIWSQWQQLELHDGKLYRRRICKEGRSDTLQLLVPASIKDDYMRQAHSGMCGGHLGLRRTMDQIQRRAFWVGWRRDVKRFCRNCPSCNGYFRGKLPRSAPLQPLLTGAPFERLHVDLTGPHPRSRWWFSCRAAKCCRRTVQTTRGTNNNCNPWSAAGQLLPTKATTTRRSTSSLQRLNNNKMGTGGGHPTVVRKIGAPPRLQPAASATMKLT